MSDRELSELATKVNVESIPRGALLVKQDEPADALYLVLSGRFQVLRDNRAEPLTEIGAGHPIGEIAFVGGGRRTASVRAQRDCLVLKLGRTDFDALALRRPELWAGIAANLAERFGEARRGQLLRTNLPHTIAICRAGQGGLPEAFSANLRRILERRSDCIILDPGSECAAEIRRNGDSATLTGWLNELEARYNLVFYLADPQLTPWSRKCLRQADLVLCVADHKVAGSETNPNALECFAGQEPESAEQRLVLVHDARSAITGTRQWLDQRAYIRLHHHVAREALADYRRLVRFIDGTALGLVACGGGAFSAAHLGVYQALREVGLDFDMMGGTSGGSAMTAALAAGLEIDEIERRLDDMLIKGRALKRWTWPRYSLIDHTGFDRALAHHYGDVDIEDLWVPYFAASTNLTTNQLFYHRRGLLWHAVRASGSLPALLPPFFTAEGDTLVDGALLDNVPVAAMRSFKSGPNVVISFEMAEERRVRVSYASLPSRNRLLWSLLVPRLRRRLPAAPGPLSVLTQSLMVSRRRSDLALDPRDLVLTPPIAAEVGIMNWRHHSLLRRQAYEYAVDQLNLFKRDGHPLLRNSG